jgi:hypothetical protein
LKKPLEGVDLQFQQRAFKRVARAVDAHIAPGLGQVIGLVVLQPFGADHHVPAAQLGVAVDHGFKIGAAGQPVA